MLEAPRLELAGQLWKDAWLRGYLKEDHRPGVLEGAEELEDLVHFLLSAKDSQEPARGHSAVTLERGRQLFHSVGCVACHVPEEWAEDLKEPLWAFQGGFEGEAPGEVDAGNASSLVHLSAKFHAQGLKAFLLDPLKYWPDGRMPDMGLSEGEAAALAAYLLAEELRDGSLDFEQLEGLSYRYFEGDWNDELEPYLSSEPVRTGVHSDFAQLPEHADDKFAFLFDGFVNIPADGLWNLSTESDDGSRLYVDGELWADNAGHHPMVQKGSERFLTAGLHAISVTYFEATGGEGLVVRWRGPGVEESVIPKEALSSWLLDEPSEEADASAGFVLDPERAARGGQLYEGMQCVRCHGTPGEFIVKGIKDPQAGCLTEIHTGGTPRFDWQPGERDALLGFLTANGRGYSFDAEIDWAFERLQCGACHERNGRGGPSETVRAYFQGQPGVDLGNEGRFPPHLNGVGSKLKREALLDVLAGEGHVRPYLKTRMPRFGESNVAWLADALKLADTGSGGAVLPEPQAGDIEHGIELAGVRGLGCVQCHVHGEHGSTGIQAVDLTSMSSRLEPAWFRQVLLDPKSLGMNSRMPEFWVDGLSPVDVLERDPERQVDALWGALSLGSSMPLPEGLLVSQDELTLTPLDEPRMVGVFLEGASPRSLLVGFSERIHYAFDVQNSQLAAIWRGDFFNAHGTWHARAGKLESPFGTDFLRFGRGAALAYLDSEDQPWPQGNADEVGVRRKGRSMNASGVPSFHYELDDLRVTEELSPLLSLDGAQLVRRWTIRGQGPRRASLRLAAGKSIELVTPTEDMLGKQVWQIDNYRIELSSDVAVRLREMHAESDLVVELGPDQTDIEVVLSW